MKLHYLGLIVNHKKKKALDVAKKIVDWSNLKDIKVCIEKIEGQSAISDAVDCFQESFLKKAELVISLGGDGTLLRAARLASLKNIPVFGINLGGLGFLTQIGTDELETCLDRLFRGEYFIEERMMLECSIKRKDNKGMNKFISLNDIVIGKGAFARLVCLATYVNDYYVITYSADGLVLSTSTGSTAYSLSAGGPIINPKIKCMLVTPICPHTLSARPLIIGENDRVRIDLESVDEEVMLTIDGQVGFSLKYKDEVTVKKSRHKTKLITFKEKNFYTILREKLKWSGQVNF